jgi:CheY-like chemotaxis protein
VCFLACQEEKGISVALKILFADDSMTAQNMGKKILSDAGYEVVAVSNGAAALKKINEIKPELVVLDVYMPGYTGLEVCEKMRAAHETSKTPVLLTVGKMEAYKPEDGARVKANGVIVKPFEATDLLAAIEKLTGGIKAAAAAQKTVPMPTPGSEQEAGQEWKSEAVEEIQATKPESVSVPSEMASHAAYGYDDLLSASASAHAPAVEATPSLPAFQTASAAAVAGQPEASAPQHSENSLEAEFVISPVQVPSAAEFGVSSSFGADLQESAAQEEAPVAGKTKESLLERFDAILKDGFSASKTSGFEATAAEPTPDIPVATETGLEPTIQKLDDSTEITPEPGLDPFSSEATASGQAEYQSWDVSESTREQSLEPATEVTAAPAAEASIETISLHQYAAPDVQPEECTTEPLVLSAETEIDDFEKRVAEAMAAFQAAEPEQEHEIAPAITEREAEDAELVQSKYALAQETEYVGDVHETKASPVASAYNAAPTPDHEITDALAEAEPYVIEEEEPLTPVKAAAAAASAAGDSELARALAEAVAAQNKVAAIHVEEPTAEAGKIEISRAEPTPKPMEATMITKIVTRVLEHSLPDILNKVMTELEKEERDKKK